jgi:hypothetical protein
MRARGRTCGTVPTMRRTLVTASVLVSLIALGACSDSEPAGKEGASKNTLAPGMTILPGSIESQKVTDLPEACDDAVAPLRALMGKYDSGLEITDAADNTKLTDMMTTAATECEDEYKRFYEGELLGWLNAEPSTVPVAPAPTTPAAGGPSTKTPETKPASDKNASSSSSTPTSESKAPTGEPVSSTSPSVTVKSAPRTTDGK